MLSNSSWLLFDQVFVLEQAHTPRITAPLNNVTEIYHPWLRNTHITFQNATHFTFIRIDNPVECTRDISVFKTWSRWLKRNVSLKSIQLFVSFTCFHPIDQWYTRLEEKNFPISSFFYENIFKISWHDAFIRFIQSELVNIVDGGCFYRCHCSQFRYHKLDSSAVFVCDSLLDRRKERMRRKKWWSGVMKCKMEFHLCDRD